MLGITEMKDSTKFFFNKFHGIYTIKNIDIKEDEKVTVNYSNELESGKFNVVILDSDYKLYTFLMQTKREV